MWLELNFKTWRLSVLAVELVFTLAVSTFSLAQTSTPTPLTIDQTNVPIRVDGHLNDWPEVRMIPLGQKSQITMGENFWKGEDDFNGRVFLTYDAQFLYIAAIVQKSGRVVNSNDKLSLWNGDCVELFLSTRPNPSGPPRLTRGDYHVGFSPGLDCKNPQMFCFNKNQTIQGGRVIARKTLKGYLMEACVPLAFFEGLDLGPGKTAMLDVALDKGGELSGYRILQFDYAGKDTNEEDPATWIKAQWIGKIEQSVPLEETEDLYANLVHDGTSNATYGGIKTVSGVAVDANGKALSGVKVNTWPNTRQALTDSNGGFQLKRVKIYGKTVLYGRLDGYISTLSKWQPGPKPVTLRLSPLPAPLTHSFDGVSNLFFGQSIPAEPPGQFDTLLATLAPWMKPLNPGLIRLNLASPI